MDKTRYLFDMLYGIQFTIELHVHSFLCSAWDWTKGLVHFKHTLQLPQVYDQDVNLIGMSVS